MDEKRAFISRFLDNCFQKSTHLSRSCAHYCTRPPKRPEAWGLRLEKREGRATRFPRKTAERNLATTAAYRIKSGWHFLLSFCFPFKTTPELEKQLDVREMPPSALCAKIPRGPGDRVPRPNNRSLSPISLHHAP